MYRIKTLNKISPAGLSVLDQTRYTISTDVENEDGILVRSADMHDYAFPDALRAVARAGAGTNNIPIDRCSEAGIVVFNTPGANANAVKELAVCALLLASRKISDGVAWVKEQAAAGADVEQAVEKGKSQFVGPELSGKMLGVIGLGAIGVQVANIATKLGMTVFGYDPFLSVDGALSLSRLVHRAMDLETIYKNCDYITLHVPQTPETKGMFNEDAFHMMKGGVRILNLARGTLVNDDDMLAALAARMEEPLEEHSGLAAADHAERAAVRDGLRRVLEGLSREERRLFTLRFVYGLSSAELGGVLGLSPNGVDARVSRLRKKLKRLLARQGLGLWEREGTK